MVEYSIFIKYIIHFCSNTKQKVFADLQSNEKKIVCLCDAFYASQKCMSIFVELMLMGVKRCC